MPLVVVHFVVSAILSQYLCEKRYGRGKYPAYYPLLGGIFGLVPDLDLPISAILTRFIDYDPTLVHNVYTHVIWIPMMILGIAFLLDAANLKATAIAYLLAVGYSTHITLDFFIGGAKMVFYPVSRFIFFGLGPISGILHFAEMLDAVVFVVWVVYLYRTKQLTSYY